MELNYECMHCCYINDPVDLIVIHSGVVNNFIQTILKPSGEWFGDTLQNLSFMHVILATRDACNNWSEVVSLPTLDLFDKHKHIIVGYMLMHATAIDMNTTYVLHMSHIFHNNFHDMNSFMLRSCPERTNCLPYIFNSFYWNPQMFCFWRDYLKTRYNLQFDYTSYKQFVSESYTRETNDYAFHGKWDCLLTELFLREYDAATLIQHTWKESISNPSFELCKNRLLREFTQNTDLYET